MLKQRIATALVLLPLVLGAIFYLSTPWFALAMMVPVVVGAWEWANIMGLQQPRQRVGYGLFIAVGLALVYWLHADYILLISLIWWIGSILLVSAYPGKTELWAPLPVMAAIGVLLFLPAWWGLVVLHRQQEGAWWLLYALLLVWGADTGAYFAGRTFGKHKLAPDVSPGKTIEGLVGGLLVTSIISVLVAFQTSVLQNIGLIGFLLVSMASVVGSVYGDLAESMFKRHRGIKDSSQILPGHGGVLDRIDSITAAIPLFAGGMLLLGAFH